MNIIAVDDERHAAEGLRGAVGATFPEAEVVCFSAAEEALSYAQERPVDVAFLDIELPEMNGIILAKRLKALNPETNIIFLTGYSSYMGEAFQLHASGYVTKPVSPEKVLEELSNLRSPLPRPGRGVYVQCFGNFELFLNGKPLRFSQAKAKEMLAYLVDRRGAGVTKKELAAVLLENREYSRGAQSYLHRIVVSLLGTLEEAGQGGLILKNRNLYAVDTARFRCDLYEFERGLPAAATRFCGEYMTNYSWAEGTLAQLLESHR